MARTPARRPHAGKRMDMMGMKSCLKRKIFAVAGKMGRGQNYGGNAADQIIQHQPAGDAQYEVPIK